MIPELSVVIPCFNEERRLPGTLSDVYEYLSGRRRSFEIVVVDDGSLDQTPQIVENFAQTRPEVRLVSYSPNMGKGHAVRVGMLAGKGELILFDDADGSSPIAEVERLEKAIADGADIAIGSRAKPDETRRVVAKAHRKFIGNTFNFIVQSLLVRGFHDTQCGFKLFKRKAARDIFKLTRLNGFAFDVEVLYLARIKGYKVEEIAINWTNVEGSKVNVLTDSPKMFLQILSVAVRSWFGRYNHPSRSRDAGSIKIIPGTRTAEHRLPSLDSNDNEFESGQAHKTVD